MQVSQAPPLPQNQQPTQYDPLKEFIELLGFIEALSASGDSVSYTITPGLCGLIISNIKVIAHPIHNLKAIKKTYIARWASR